MPPVLVQPGFSIEVVERATHARAHLAGLLSHRQLHGYSTHISVSVPTRIVDAVACEFISLFTPAMMLLMDRSDSPGLLVRPRPGRLELGGMLETGPVVLHFPREKIAAERALLARDAEVSWRSVRDFAGLPIEGGKVHVFLYRSAEEKRRLIGAAETSFTKPWLRQIHTNDAPAPHPILRHELAHAAFADLSHGAFAVPGRLLGLVPDMALVEGAAVAADWPPGEFTVDDEARALRELKLLPDLRRLFRPGLFYAESGPRAYTAAGSFVTFTPGISRRKCCTSPLPLSSTATISLIGSSAETSARIR